MFLPPSQRGPPACFCFWAVPLSVLRDRNKVETDQRLVRAAAVEEMNILLRILLCWALKYVKFSNVYYASLTKSLYKLSNKS